MVEHWTDTAEQVMTTEVADQKRVEEGYSSSQDYPGSETALDTAADWVVGDTGRDSMRLPKEGSSILSLPLVDLRTSDSRMVELLFQSSLLDYRSASLRQEIGGHLGTPDFVVLAERKASWENAFARV